MIRHLSFLFLLVALGAAIVAAQSTQQEEPSSDPAAQSGSQPMQSDQYGSRQSMQEQSLQGTIQKVDTIGNNLTIQTDNNQQATLSLDANTSIKVNGKAATVADLKAGQQATVTMEGQKAVAVDVTGGSSSSEMR